MTTLWRWRRRRSIEGLKRHCRIEGMASLGCDASKEAFDGTGLEIASAPPFDCLVPLAPVSMTARVRTKRDGRIYQQTPQHEPCHEYQQLGLVR